MIVACLVREDVVFLHLKAVLAARGLSAMRAHDEVELVRCLQRASADVVCADVVGESSMEDRLVTWLQCRTGRRAPVVFRVADGDVEHMARLLEVGADDVVRRGCEPVELVARLCAAVRRQHRPEETVRSLSVAGFELERAGQRTRDRGVPVELTTREFMLAWLLFANAGRCLSRKTISVAVWGTQADITSRTMEQHIYRLRKKLGLSEARGVSIRTSYGLGYVLEARAEACERAEAALGSKDLITLPEPMRELAAHVAKPDIDLSRHFGRMPAGRSPRDVALES